MRSRSATSLCHNLPQHSKLCIQRKLLCVILSKKYTFSFLNCATNQEVAITCLVNATELQTMHHLIAKDKVPEQYIFNRNTLNAIVSELKVIYSE